MLSPLGGGTLGDPLTRPTPVSISPRARQTPPKRPMAVSHDHNFVKHILHATKESGPASTAVDKRRDLTLQRASQRGQTR